MIIAKRTDAQEANFQLLVKELDIDLAIRDGEDHTFYAQFNTTATIKFAVVAYKNNLPVGCGAIKEFSAEAMEVKRMFVPIHERGKGVASMVLTELERWAAEMGYPKCVLETGKKQPEAIKLYLKNGYKVVANYGQYIGVENSVCFEKNVSPL